MSHGDPGVGPAGQATESGSTTPVGIPKKVAPGPVTSTVPPVRKKPGTPGGRNALPVMMVQPVRSKAAWNGLVGPPELKYVVI